MCADGWMGDARWLHGTRPEPSESRASPFFLVSLEGTPRYVLLTSPGIPQPTPCSQPESEAWEALAFCGVTTRRPRIPHGQCILRQFTCCSPSTVPRRCIGSSCFSSFFPPS